VVSTLWAKSHAWSRQMELCTTVQSFANTSTLYSPTQRGGASLTAALSAGLLCDGRLWQMG